MSAPEDRAPVICWPWALGDLLGPDVARQGGDCARCGRAVAVPVSDKRRPLVCCYCALDLGLAGAADDRPLEFGPPAAGPGPSDPFAPGGGSKP